MTNNIFSNFDNIESTSYIYSSNESHPIHNLSNMTPQNMIHRSFTLGKSVILNKDFIFGNLEKTNKKEENIIQQYIKQRKEINYTSGIKLVNSFLTSAYGGFMLKETEYDNIMKNIYKLSNIYGNYKKIFQIVCSKNNLHYRISDYPSLYRHYNILLLHKYYETVSVIINIINNVLLCTMDTLKIYGCKLSHISGNDLMLLILHCIKMYEKKYNELCEFEYF